MDLTLIINALGLIAQSSMPFVIAAACGALLIGVFQVATQISDEALGFAARFGAIALVLYLLGGSISSTVLHFAQRVWTETSTYQ